MSTAKPEADDVGFEAKQEDDSEPGEDVIILFLEPKEDFIIKANLLTLARTEHSDPSRNINFISSIVNLR